MLELLDLTLHPPGAAEDARPIVEEITARLPLDGHLLFVLGPSGCGKSTLLKLIAGLHEPSAGQLRWEGRDLSTEGDLAPQEIGYVPQFSVAWPALTVRESVEAASRLRVDELSEEERSARLQTILAETGLEEIADRRVGVLSGGQRRRLALALEMVADPRLLLCDEVTSGLDPKAEDEIAQLLHRLARHLRRLVVNVTHSLRHLALCDSVLVLHEGRLVYHGPPGNLFHYFGVEHQEELFAALAQRSAEEWHLSWLKHRESYYEAGGWAEAPAAPASEPAVIEPAFSPSAPSLLTQFSVLLRRRWLLLWRDRGQLALQIALLLGFPCLVVIFALKGLPEVASLSSPVGSTLYELKANEVQVRASRISAGSLASGLIMFQVILLALMGANNSAREIAGERMIFEKEKFAGLRPGAYILSKAAYLGGLVFLQSAWMTLFVHWVVHFPGPLTVQFALLLAVNAALTSVCLGLSAILRTADQASLVSVYLVGFQLPLSGAVLALPSVLAGLVKPFIAAAWGWAGFIRSFQETRLYEAIQSLEEREMAPVALCLWVLLCHVGVGLYLAWAGVRRSQWE